MAQNTELTNDIVTTEYKARYDNAAKRILSNKTILAWIMKSCLDEFKDYDIETIADKCIEGTPIVSGAAVDRNTADKEIIKGTSADDATITEGTVYFDIKFDANTLDDERVNLIINVEAQNDLSPGYPIVKRGLYYGSRLISAQKGTVFTGEHYEKIQKVYSIWVLVNTANYNSDGISKYSVCESILKGNNKQKKEDFDLITVYMLYLSNESGRNSDGIIRLLSVLLSNEVSKEEKLTILEDEFKISPTRDFEEGVNVMCNLSEGIERKALEKGIQALVEAFKEINVLEDTIVEKVIEKYGISQENAEAAVKKYGKQ